MTNTGGSIIPAKEFEGKLWILADAYQQAMQAAYMGGVLAEREACKELMLKAMRVLEEAQTYTSCQAWSPSMTEECKQMEEALRNYMYDKLAEKHADNMKKDIKVMTDWVKKETEAIRARG